jgi:Penicillin binding protein transpeptidase domain
MGKDRFHLLRYFRRAARLPAFRPLGTAYGKMDTTTSATAYKVMPEFVFEDQSNFTCRREFLSLLLALICSMRVKSSLANGKFQGHFYFSDLKAGSFERSDADAVKGKPGSLMKLVIAAAFCESKLPAAHQSIICNGTTIVDGERFSCRAAHGKVDLSLALGYSCNVFFATTVHQLNVKNLSLYIERFGLKVSSTALHRDALSIRKFVNFALGLSDSIQVDGMQIVRAISLIALKGKLPSGSQQVSFSERTWEVLQEGMRMAVRKGSARNLDPEDKLHIAAKTGTSTQGEKFQSWIAGYFPFEEPRYVFCVRAPSGTSWDAAVPLARQFLASRSWP